MPPATGFAGRGLHSPLHLSRFGAFWSLKPPKLSHKMCSRGAEKWTSLSPCSPVSSVMCSRCSDPVAVLYDYDEFTAVTALEMERLRIPGIGSSESMRVSKPVRSAAESALRQWVNATLKRFTSDDVTLPSSSFSSSGDSAGLDSRFRAAAGGLLRTSTRPDVEPSRPPPHVCMSIHA